MYRFEVDQYRAKGLHEDRRGGEAGRRGDKSERQTSPFRAG